MRPGNQTVARIIRSRVVSKLKRLEFKLIDGMSINFLPSKGFKRLESKLRDRVSFNLRLPWQMCEKTRVDAERRSVVKLMAK